MIDLLLVALESGNLEGRFSWSSGMSSRTASIVASPKSVVLTHSYVEKHRRSVYSRIR